MKAEAWIFQSSLTSQLSAKRPPLDVYEFTSSLPCTVSMKPGSSR